MSVAPAISPEITGLDEQHPWPGLEFFTENDSEYFYGRDDETADLFRLAKRDTLTVLFGSSGLGKTSLLKAGLFPKLIEAEFLPISLRLTHSDAPEPLADQVRRGLEALIDAHHVDAPKPMESEALSAYFHRKDVDFWGTKNRLLIPVLVFDQFEEIFTLGRENAARRARAKDFLKELADLVERRPPTALKQKWESGEEDVTNFSFERERCKIILSLREDYLSDLEGLRPFMRSVMRNRLRIRAMNGENAFKVVVKPAPGLVDNEVATHLVQLVANPRTPVEDAPLSEDQLKELEIEPALLSLVCSELNARRIEHKQAKITTDLLAKSYHDILKTFYNESVAKNLPQEVRFFIEDRLLTGSGYRTSVAIEDALAQKGMTQEIIDRLVKRRLLRIEDRLGVRSIELTHDILTAVIRESRDSRRTSEARAEADRLRRKQRITAAVAGALALALIATIWGGYYAFIQEHEKYYREFEKRDGFPSGIMEISEDDARKLPVSFRLIHKGIEGGLVFDGWKLHWKPVHWKRAFRVKALNGLLELTTNHSVFPSLWKGEPEFEGAQDYELGAKGEQLGLRTVCQWEFVSTREGEISYERALDRVGRMVYGVVYSPRGSASLSTRSARFVGPNGFPRKLQRPSAAEYVQIHYDGAGREARIMYFDAKGLAVAGPNGAFGESMLYNDRGQLTRGLSLDEFGNPTIDNDGNSGMESKYDEKGYDIEDTSVGPDLQPRSLKDGYVICKNQYDKFGVLHRTTYHDANGKPVLSKKDGYHGWETEYDKQGNRTVETYLGLDEKPMALADGYATVKSTYNARGKEIRRTFHGVNDEPVLSKKDGYHSWKAEYNEQGNQTVITYLGLDEKPMALADGYATLKSTYDARGNMSRMRFYGVKGEAVVSKKYGHHGWEADYDKQGRRTILTYIGPTSIADGFATLKSTYDAGGKMTQARFYGVNDEPVLSKKDGYHSWKAEYDEQGNQTVETYLGLDEKPMAVADGYATMKSTYDADRKEIRRTFHGVNGEPVQHKDGYYGWKAKYDEQGNKTVETYLSLDGRPRQIADGYATKRMAYDSRGNVIRQTFHGINGEPVQHKDGYYGRKADYDEQGNKTVETYLSLDGKPTLGADGYATVKSTYDASGKMTGQSYYGLNGEQVADKHGRHRFEVRYDQRGNETKTYFGLDGKPRPMKLGSDTPRKMPRTRSQRVSRE